MSKKRKKLVFSILAILVAITLLLTASMLVSCDPDAAGNSGQTGSETGGQTGGGETTGGETTGGETTGGETTGGETTGGETTGGETTGGETTGGETTGGETTGGETTGGETTGGETTGGETTGGETAGGETTGGETTGGETTGGETTGGETTGGETTGGETTGGETGGETSEPSDADVAAAKAVFGAFKAGVVDQDMAGAVQAAGAVVGTTLEDTPEFRAALEAELASFDQAFAEAYETTLPEGGLANFDFPEDGLLHVGFMLPLGDGTAMSATLRQRGDGAWNFKLETPDDDELMTIDAIVDKDEHGNLRINADTTRRDGPDAAPSYDNHDMVLFGDEGLGPDDLVMESRSKDGIDIKRIRYFDLSNAPEDALLLEWIINTTWKMAGEGRFLRFDENGLPIRASVSETRRLEGEDKYADKTVNVNYYAADPAFFPEAAGLSCLTFAEDEGEVPTTALDMVAEMLETRKFRERAQSADITWEYPVEDGEVRLDQPPEFGWLELTARVEGTLEEAQGKLEAAGYTGSGSTWSKDSFSVWLHAPNDSGPVEAELTISGYPEGDDALKAFVDGWIAELGAVRDKVQLADKFPSGE